MKQVYIAGDMLLKGSQLVRQQEREQIEALGVKVYNPMDDKEINDKTNQTKESNDGLAEKIVRKDMKAILDSDVIVIAPESHALGTITELGQIYGINYMLEQMYSALVIAEQLGDKRGMDYIQTVVEKIPYKEVYAHYDDIRRTDIPEQGDRRSFGVNQYVYGTVLALTQGRGFQEFDEIVESLKSELEVTNEG